jgi:hypothetical protein
MIADLLLASKRGPQRIRFPIGRRQKFDICCRSEGMPCSRLPSEKSTSVCKGIASNVPASPSVANCQ